MFSCADIEKQERILMKWTKFDLDLPRGIEVYQGNNEKIPLKAWVTVVDLSSPKISVKILSSSDVDRKETPMQFLESTGARVVINGGYFIMDNSPSSHVGLLKTNGRLEEPASQTVFREGIRYFINRGAFGIKGDGKVNISWCSTQHDSIFSWESPLENRPGLPADSLKFLSSTYWDVFEGIHAGPVIVYDGQLINTIEEEVFFNTPISGVQPRSAVGYTKENKLVMMVVDGRQQDSRGVYLEELGNLMLQFNCYRVLNLDGGGSSAMVADSRLLNRPSGRSYQREVMSAIGIFYDE